LLKQHKDNTYASMEQSCYWNYLRVLAPRGSALQAAEGIADAGMADDIGVISAFGGYLVVPRASTRAVRLTYALPHGVWNDTAYHLRLDAQAGTGPMPVTVQVVLPPGYSLRGASDSYTWVDKQTVQIQTRLSHDTTLVLYFNSPFQGLAR
jgi:hypothetical protein